MSGQDINKLRKTNCLAEKQERDEKVFKILTSDKKKRISPDNCSQIINQKQSQERVRAAQQLLAQVMFSMIAKLQISLVVIFALWKVAIIWL